MTNFVSPFRSALIALSMGTVAVAPVAAAPWPEIVAPPQFQTVQADCYAIGQKVAADNGGTLFRASLSTQGGQPVCVIVVVVPGKDGKRGQRQEFVVPAG